MKVDSFRFCHVEPHSDLNVIKLFIIEIITKIKY